MTKLIIIDTCTGCPYFFRFVNPKSGRVCFKVKEKDPVSKEEYWKTIAPKWKDSIPDWCPLQEAGK